MIPLGQWLVARVEPLPLPGGIDGGFSGGGIRPELRPVGSEPPEETEDGVQLPGKAVIETERAREAMRAEMQAALESEREALARAYGTAIAEKLATAIENMRRAIERQLEEALKPIVKASIRSRIAESFVQELGKSISGPGDPQLAVRAPKDMLPVLRGKLDSLGINAALVEADDGEIDVDTSGLSLRSAMSGWFDEILGDCR